MGIRIESAIKEGKKIVGYIVTDGIERRQVTKEQVISAINSIENAKVQKYQGRYIVRVQDEIETEQIKSEKEVKQAKVKAEKPKVIENTVSQKQTNVNKGTNKVEFNLVVEKEVQTPNDIFNRALFIFGLQHSELKPNVQRIYEHLSTTLDMNKQYNVNDDIKTIGMIQSEIMLCLSRLSEMVSRRIYKYYEYNEPNKEYYKTKIDKVTGEEYIDINDIPGTSSKKVKQTITGDSLLQELASIKPGTPLKIKVTQRGRYLQALYAGVEVDESGDKLKNQHVFYVGSALPKGMIQLTSRYIRENNKIVSILLNENDNIEIARLHRELNE